MTWDCDVKNRIHSPIQDLEQNWRSMCVNKRQVAFLCLIELQKHYDWWKEQSWCLYMWLDMSLSCMLTIYSHTLARQCLIYCITQVIFFGCNFCFFSLKLIVASRKSMRAWFRNQKQEFTSKQPHLTDSTFDSLVMTSAFVLGMTKKVSSIKFSFALCSLALMCHSTDSIMCACMLRMREFRYCQAWT